MHPKKITAAVCLLELTAAAGVAAGIVLEMYYFKTAGAGLFNTVVTCLVVAGLYLLFTVMEHYPAVWNILIPATQKNRRWAVRLALGMKVLFMCMTTYTAVCDVWNIYSSPVVFWLVIVAGIILLVYTKYRMWRSNEQDKKNSGKNDRA